MAYRSHIARSKSSKVDINCRFWTTSASTSNILKILFTKNWNISKNGGSHVTGNGSGPKAAVYLYSPKPPFSAEAKS